MTKYFYAATSPETAHSVPNWPWGYKLKTTKKFWVETKKGFGQRVCAQTINPKTGRECKPKKSTYNPVMIIAEHTNNEGVVTTSSVGIGAYAGAEVMEAFKQKHEGNLSEFQMKALGMEIKIDKIITKAMA